MMKTHEETELELAWLVKYLPKDLTSHKSSEIKQAYLDHNDPAIKDTRIREKDGKFTYTVKKFIKDPQETGYNKEETKLLTKKEFMNLWEKAKKKTRKVRYYYPLKGGLIAEVDIYRGNLDGLVVVEIEFPTIEDYKNFKAPKWFGEEVTDSNGIYPPYIADMDIKEVNELNRQYSQKPHNFE